MVFSMPKEKSVGAIVFHNENENPCFLLLLYGAGHWDLPKGHIEGNENEMQTMFRELKEETGLEKDQLELIPGFREQIHYFYKSKNKTVFKEVVFFLVKAKHSNIKLSHEHKAFKWLPIEEALQTATFKTAKQLLEKASMLIENSKK